MFYKISRLLSRSNRTGSLAVSRTHQDAVSVSAGKFVRPAGPRLLVRAIFLVLSVFAVDLFVAFPLFGNASTAVAPAGFSRLLSRHPPFTPVGGGFETYLNSAGPQVDWIWGQFSSSDQSPQSSSPSHLNSFFTHRGYEHSNSFSLHSRVSCAETDLRSVPQCSFRTGKQGYSRQSDSSEPSEQSDSESHFQVMEMHFPSLQWNSSPVQDLQEIEKWQPISLI